MLGPQARSEPRFHGSLDVSLIETGHVLGDVVKARRIHILGTFGS
jgi:hypothetical protein